ncbi:hypothetical protein GDO81_019629 [Engystomops pustulosus]|uniref:Uncharacterized protein n=1 Tax=Engystomops pustulosus TaxID=76066 RepID=A0AAV6ZKA3_ENGPU|nr:hypothetical protein GDO81_019629 [Engystomops pustulosus]
MRMWGSRRSCSPPPDDANLLSTAVPVSFSEWLSCVCHREKSSWHVDVVTHQRVNRQANARCSIISPHALHIAERLQSHSFRSALLHRQPAEQ